jgi:uncharacterized membrane protein YccC
MADIVHKQHRMWANRAATRLNAILANAGTAAGGPLLFGLRLWISVCLALYVAFWLQLDNAVWAGTSAALVSQPQLGASLRKGWYRMIGTVVGAVAIVLLTALFVQEREAFLVALALWGAGCALLATLLRNFAAYAAALAGYTAAIIAADTLGATGGPNNDVFMFAVTRVSEICIGIVCAGVVLAGTDLGDAQRRLAAPFAALIAEITTRFTGTLALAGPNLPETQPVRRDLVRRVIALDPVIDQAIGESSQLRAYSPVLQRAVDGLLAALAAWRMVAVCLARRPDDKARQDANFVLQRVPDELRSMPERSEPAFWTADPVGLRRLSEATAQTLLAAPAGTPSSRMIADQTARVFAGISDALNGLALLADILVRPRQPNRGIGLHVPDWLPSIVNGARAFVVIGATAIFWVATAWPNGALAITFASIIVILFAPNADQAVAGSVGFMVGAVLAACFAAIIKFAVLPGLETFEALSIVMGLYLIPVGAALAQGWQPSIFTGMIVLFVPLLAPANQMNYDTLDYYNTAVAIIAGGGAGALSFRLLPPLSPAFRARRLLALSLRDLRRLAASPTMRTLDDWTGRIYARLVVLPEGTEPLQRSQLVVTLSAGNEIIKLRHMAPMLGLSSDVEAAFMALAQGNSTIARTRLSQLDRRLASDLSAQPDPLIALRARASILAISEAIAQHASYFDTGART